MNFSEKLRKVTVNKDAKFIDYRPETGSWVFKVDHFSRYGFDESDEETVQKNGKEGAEKKMEGVSTTDVPVQTKMTVEKATEKESLAKSSPNEKQVNIFNNYYLSFFI